MNRTSTSLIWKKLLLEDTVIVTSREIFALALELGKKPVRSLKYLKSMGYLERIFRGIYYVYTPEEMEMGGCDYSIYEIVAMGLQAKGVKGWYFGLETGLKMNRMTHEFFTIDHVITDIYKTTKPIDIMDYNVRFLRWRSGYQRFGLVKRGGIRFSDPEKTVLDLMYKRFKAGHSRRHYISIMDEYERFLDMDVLERYLDHYPIPFQNRVELEL